MDYPTSIPEIVTSPEPAGRPIPTDDDALLFEAEAAYLLGESVRTVQGRRIRGDGPAYIKLGQGLRSPVRYTRRLLRQYHERQIRRSTSERHALATAIEQ